MSKFQNTFAAFADKDDEPVAPVQRKAAPKEEKKVVVKVKKANVTAAEAQEGFETVERKQPAGAQRGRGDQAQRGRGGERGRGGRGGRGGDRGGDRGGRGGRGGRPRTGLPAEEGTADVERAERGGQRERFQGKAREGAHPFDRKDGTGKAHRERKQGHGKGNWGKDKPEQVGAQEETKDEVPEKKEEEVKPVEEEKKEEPEQPEEEVYVGKTLDDYLAEKQATSKGLLAQKNTREHEKVTDKNLQAQEVDFGGRVAQRNNKLAGRDTYTLSRGTGAELLGFSGGKDEEEFESSRPSRGRGGRGGRPDRPPQQRAGRRGGKFVVNDDNFPAL